VESGLYLHSNILALLQSGKTVQNIDPELQLLVLHQGSKGMHLYLFGI